MTATMTTTMTTTETATQTATPEGAGDCYENDVSFELTPGLGSGKKPMIEFDFLACQERCEKTIGCLHFSYLKYSGQCHLHDGYAKRHAKAMVGSIAGPFKCWQDIPKNDFTCLEWGTQYQGDQVGKARNFSQGAFHHSRHAVIACQRLCAAIDGCAHFVIEIPPKECKLMGKNAIKKFPVIQSIAGPPGCNFALQDTQGVIVFWTGGIVKHGGSFFATLAGAMLAICLACSGCMALHRTGRISRMYMGANLWSGVPPLLPLSERDALLLTL